MKGLTLTQPWATLVAVGAKTLETRSWRSRRHTGQHVAIHAASACTPAEQRLVEEPPFRDALRRGLRLHPGQLRPGRPPIGVRQPAAVDLPLGVIVAIAQLVNCLPTDHPVIRDELEASPAEAAFGDFSTGRWAWILASATPLPEPVPYRGGLGLWTVDHRVEPLIYRQLFDRGITIPSASCPHPRRATGEACPRCGLQAHLIDAVYATAGRPAGARP